MNAACNHHRGLLCVCGILILAAVSAAADLPDHLVLYYDFDEEGVEAITGHIHEDIDGVYCQDVNDFAISNCVVRDCTWSGVIVNNTIWNNANEADVTIWRGASAVVVNNILEDIDGDCKVGWKDVEILSRQWLKNSRE